MPDVSSCGRSSCTSFCRVVVVRVSQVIVPFFKRETVFTILKTLHVALLLLSNYSDPLSLAKNKNQLNPKRVWDRESKMPMDSTVDFSAFYRDETGFGQETTGREARTRTGKFARKASRSIKQEILISFLWTGSASGEFWFLKQEKLFGNPIRRTESGRLCYVSRSDLYNVDTDTETDVDRAWLRNTLLRHDFYYVIR